MQFQMPRFLDIEDKVIGPLTFKQFIYLAGGAGLAYLAYSYLGLTFGFIFIALFLFLGVSLSFWKPNNRPAIIMFQAFLNHYTKNRMYVWQRPTKAERIKKEEEKKDVEKIIGKKVDHGKIESLAWSLDVLDRNMPSGQTEKENGN
jgi:hypothetical protein